MGATLERAVWLGLGVVLLADGGYSLLWNERGAALRETVEDLFGERADYYLVAGLLGLAELAAGVWLVGAAVLPGRASTDGP